jgi:hypothetical protein
VYTDADPRVCACEHSNAAIVDAFGVVGISIL